MGQNQPSWRTLAGDFPADKISELIFREQAFNLCLEDSNFELRSCHHYLYQKGELRPSGKATVEVFLEGSFLWESLQEDLFSCLPKGHILWEGLPDATLAPHKVTPVGGALLPDLP